MKARRRSIGDGVVCPDCGTADAIRIRLRLDEETAVNFSSCHRCEHRWWDADGEVLDLNSVLERVRQR
jgi:Zn ribbon nucleic-acid-binding protein